MSSKKTPAAKKVADTAPEPRKQLNPQAADDPMAKAAMAQANGPKSASDAGQEAEEAGEDTVRAYVPHTFRLTRDDHTVIEYTEGVHAKMPLADFEHSYAKANGVRKHTAD